MKNKKGRLDSIKAAFFIAAFWLLRCGRTRPPIVGNVNQGFLKVSYVALAAEIHDSSDFFSEQLENVMDSILSFGGQPPVEWTADSDGFDSHGQRLKHIASTAYSRV